MHEKLQYLSVDIYASDPKSLIEDVTRFCRTTDGRLGGDSKFQLKDVLLKETITGILLDGIISPPLTTSEEIPTLIIALGETLGATTLNFYKRLVVGAERERHLVIHPLSPPLTS